jgi:hypothetical protein
MSRLHVLLSAYRDAKRKTFLQYAEAAFAVADYLCELHVRDELHQRDASNPTCTPVDAARRPERSVHPMDRIDFE